MLMTFELKFKYSEKATKICPFSHFLFDIYLVASNYNWKICQIFVSFSEYLNFTMFFMAHNLCHCCWCLVVNYSEFFLATIQQSASSHQAVVRKSSGSHVRKWLKVWAMWLSLYNQVIHGPLWFMGNQKKDFSKTLSSLLNHFII